MNVLQAAFRVVVGANAEILGVFLVPGFRQVDGGQLAGKELAFQLEAHEDVEVVSHLIGFDPDQ